MRGLSFFLAAFLFASVSIGFSRTIIIDAGHGGHDRGGIPGQRISEKALALDVAKRLEKRLKRAGFRTVMTRRSDVFIPLGTRAAIGNRYRDGIFVSVHFNSATREGARGFETFYSSGSASYGLAAEIQRNLMRTTRTENRGVKRRGFYVLRKTRIPAVLVECGFLTNRAEGKLSLSSRHRQRLADAIAKAIIKRY